IAPPFPQIRISRNIEIIEVDKWILRPVHHCQRDGKVFDEATLIYPGARTCGFKNRLSSPSVRPLYCASKRDRYRSAEDCLAESIDFRWTKILLSGESHVRRWDETFGHVVPAYGRSPTDEQSLDAGKLRCHFHRDVTTERPADHHDFLKSEQTEHFCRRIRQTRTGIGAGRVWGIAGLPVTRQIEGNKAILPGESAAELLAKDLARKRISMDQQNWHVAPSSFLRHDRAVRRSQLM